MSRKVILATVGTLGDLHPFIALGIALSGRGFAPAIACAAEYRRKVEAAGVTFLPCRPAFEEIERDLGMSRAELTHRVVARSDFLLRKLVIPYVAAAYEDMLAHTAGADLVLTSSLAIGARLAAEKRGIPWIAIVLQPMMFLSAYDPPVLPKAECLSALLRRLGPGPTRYALRWADAAFAGMVEPVHRLRRDIGLAPTPLNPLFGGQFSAGGALGLYSSLLGGVQPDYPAPTTIVGFARFDSEDGAAAKLSAELEAFLSAGAEPLVFTLGSLIVNDAGSFYRESLAAARSLGKRAVLLVGEAGVASAAAWASGDVFVCTYAPHSLLFPRALAVIHQGGIGTLAQGLRSGRPQLIVPFFADQPDNAARARRLGVARSVPPDRYAAARAARELDALLHRGSYRARARAVGEILAAEDGAAQAARVIAARAGVASSSAFPADSGRHGAAGGRPVRQRTDTGAA